MRRRWLVAVLLTICISLLVDQMKKTENVTEELEKSYLQGGMDRERMLKQIYLP